VTTQETHLRRFCAMLWRRLGTVLPKERATQILADMAADSDPWEPA